jgi:hypothetical protein
MDDYMQKTPHQNMDDAYYPQPRATPQAFQMKQFNPNTEYDNSYYPIQGNMPPVNNNFSPGISIGSIPPHNPSSMVMMSTGNYAQQGYVITYITHIHHYNINTSSNKH